MAKLVRLVMLVAANKVADILTEMADVADSIMVQNGQQSATEIAEPDDDSEVDERRPMPQRIGRPRTVNAAGRQPAAPAARQQSTRIGARVVYTPAGTQKKIDAMLADLRGVKTISAFVLRDLAKHPGSLNAEVRTRADKAGYNPESVDNAIWKHVQAGRLLKAAAEE